jgi:SAM-dependent methyltransferase
MASIVEKQERARSFGLVAEEYERGRPGYPPEALDWLLGSEPLEVLDLGAGTGKLTQALLEAGHRVIALEPLAEMRAILEATAPEARTIEGTAEQVPLPARSVDVVVAGAAFHWFDQAAALAGPRPNSSASASPRPRTGPSPTSRASTSRACGTT